MELQQHGKFAKIRGNNLRYNIVKKVLEELDN